ncbi:MAG: hypothetical protein ACRDTH_29290 [Pseudonocardiaceae bacterium]
MTGSDMKADLLSYLQAAREALLWKLDGLSEYNIRRPMVNHPRAHIFPTPSPRRGPPRPAWVAELGR